MSGSNIEGAFKALFFLIGLCLLVISLIVLPFAIQAHKARQQKQRDAMASKATDLGLDFNETGDRKKYLHIDQLDDLYGSDKHVLNVLSGDFRGYPVTLFDIDFESHEFSERYEVRCKSKKFAYDFCNAQMIDYLLGHPARFIEVEKDSLAMGFDSQHSAESLESGLSHLLKIRSLMPDYLFGDGLYSNAGSPPL